MWEELDLKESLLVRDVFKYRIVVDPINPEGIADKFEEVITELGMRKHKNMVNEDVRVTYSAKQVVDKFDELISEFNKHDKVL